MWWGNAHLLLRDHKKPKKLPIANTNPATATKLVTPKMAIVCVSHVDVFVPVIVGTSTVVTRITVIVRPIIPPISETIGICID